jgi:hypothetical protein
MRAMVPNGANLPFERVEWPGPVADGGERSNNSVIGVNGGFDDLAGDLVIDDARELDLSAASRRALPVAIQRDKDRR